MMSRYLTLVSAYVLTSFALAACASRSDDADRDDERSTVDCALPENADEPRCVILRISHSESLRIDQFGYLPAADKVAVIRTPVTSPTAQDDGHEAPGTSMQLVDLNSGEVIAEGESKTLGRGRRGHRLW